MTDALFNKITVIGLGLIGSSIARAAHKHNLARTIVGFDRNELTLAYARSHKITDTVINDCKKAVEGSELIILATPPSTYAAIIQSIAPSLAQGAIVMDTASVKQAAIDAIKPYLPAHVDFIPAHPIAGSEQSGISAGRDDLFLKRHIIVTPEAAALTPALQKITSFWHTIGARLDAMPAELHDRIYGYVSHLPHALAFAAHQVLQDHSQSGDATVRKFLRLSQSNPILWSEIFTLNKNNIISALDRYLDVISHIEKELTQAPEEPSQTNDELAYTKLFPRIAASCLITTVMEAERAAGIPFARFAGTGFSDFTLAATLPPEQDIENISSHYSTVKIALAQYADEIRAIRSAIEQDDQEKLQETLVTH